MDFASKAPWVYWYQGSGCNGCGVEAEVCLALSERLQRAGIRRTCCPEQADILLITGTISAKRGMELNQLYQRMGMPRAVVAAGICAASGAVLKKYGGEKSDSGQFVPVDRYVSGCAAEPWALEEGLLQVMDCLVKSALEKVPMTDTGANLEDLKDREKGEVNEAVEGVGEE